MPSYFLEDQLKHAPGGNRKSKAAKAERTRGQNAEKDTRDELQKFSKKKVSLNNQRGAGGDISNPDVSLGCWNIEVKSRDRLSIPEWLREIKAETPPTKKPGLVFTFENEPWLAVKLKDRMNLASDLIEAAGGEVYFP